MKIESILTFSITRYLIGAPPNAQALAWKLNASVRNYYTPETEEDHALCMAFTFTSNTTCNELRKTLFTKRDEAKAAAFTFFEDHTP